MCRRILSALIVFVALSLSAIAQNADQRYVFPKFSTDPSATIILSNLTGERTTVDIDFFDQNGTQLPGVFTEISPGVTYRFTAADMQAIGVPSFDGYFVVRSRAAISVLATVPGPNGTFEIIEPSVSSENLIVPFAQGTLGQAELTILNDGIGQLPIVLAAIAQDGSTITTFQATLAPKAMLRNIVDNIMPAIVTGTRHNLSHILVRTPGNIFAPTRSLFAVARMIQFGSPTEGLPVSGTDEAFVQGVPIAQSKRSGILPILAQGGGFYTLVQIVNTVNAPGSVELVARAADGSLIPGRNPAQLTLPASGSIRMSAQNIFTFFGPIGSGFIEFRADQGVIATTGVGVPGGALAVVTSTAPDTNFAFITREGAREFFSGYSLVNTSATDANLTFRWVLDDGQAVSYAFMQLNAGTAAVRTLSELFPEAVQNGIVYILSDTPIVAATLEGRFDGAMLSPSPAMHSRPGYQPPDNFVLLTAGIVEHNGVGLPGVGIHLSGPVSISTVTDAAGTFLFPSTPPGTYTIRLNATAYTFSPPEFTFTITDTSRRDLLFLANLIGPTLTSVTPTAAVVGTSSSEIVITGGPFTPGSQIVFEGEALTTTIAPDPAGGPSAQLVKATLTALQLATARQTTLFVRNAGPGGTAASAAQTFTIGNPAPTLSGFSGVPPGLAAGYPGFVMTLTGTGFLPGVGVQVDGRTRTAFQDNATTLRVVIPAEDLAIGGNLQITAVNASPTVGPSNAIVLPVMFPIPGVLSLSPNIGEVRLEPNAPIFPLVVNGFGFRPGAKVLVGTTAVETEVLSSVQLRAGIPQSLLQVGGSLAISVENPPPTPGKSEALGFFLYNLLPVLTSAEAGAVVFDNNRINEPFASPVILRGANFGPNTIVEIGSPCGGGPLAGTGASRVSSQQIVATVTIACSGTYQIRVRTPQPGGGASAILSFDVAPASQVTTPAISALSPTSIAAGSPSFTMTISGLNFQGGAYVNFGSTILIPTSILANRIVVTVPSFLLREAGIVPITVSNPSPQGASPRVLFNIN